MKLYTLYTPSHKKMHDEWFLPTIEDDFQIIDNTIEQTCQSAKFHEKGWEKTTREKIKTFLKACEENENDYFVFSDVDIQFFAPVKEKMLEAIGDNDIALQKETGKGYCTGFFICHSNDKTKDLFHRMLNRHHEFKGDQANFNTIDKKDVKACFLPDEFWNVYKSIGKVWNGKDDFQVPGSIVMHHANWTVGVNNKIAMMEKVRKKIKK